MALSLVLMSINTPLIVGTAPHLMEQGTMTKSLPQAHQLTTHNILFI